MNTHTRGSLFKWVTIYALLGFVTICGYAVVVERRPITPTEFEVGALFAAVAIGLTHTVRRRYTWNLTSANRALVEAQRRTGEAQRLYATLSAVNRCALNPTDRKELAGAVCQALVEHSAFNLAWIGVVPKDSRELSAFVVRGAAAGKVGQTVMPLDPDKPGGKGASPSAVRTGRLQVRNDLLNDPTAAVWHPIARQYDFRSCAAIPFRLEDGISGVLTVYSGLVNYFSAESVALMEELGRDLQHGLEVIAARERHAAAVLAVRESERRYRMLAENIQDVIWTLSLEGRFTYVSPSIERLCGYTAAETLTRSITEILTPASAAVAESLFAHMLHSARQTGRVDGGVFEFEQRCKQGGTVWVEVSTSGLHDDRGRCAGILGVSRDLTERRRASAALRESEARFLRAQRLESIGLLAGGVAHDLNNVLTPVLMSTGLLRTKRLDAEMRALVDTMEASARRGAGIVKQILTFARGVDGEKSYVQPRHLFKELARLVGQTFPRHIEHRLEVADDVSPVIGDPTQLHQVLLNLAVNARDAMPDGGVLTLRLHNQRVDEALAAATPGARPGEYVVFSVADTGHGIAPHVLDHMFEPFFSTKPRDKGTGLGLSTVHGIVTSHGGFVQVASQPGHGAEFRVCLPAQPPERPAARPPVAAARLQGRGRRVLVADDEPAIREIASAILSRRGFAVTTAADGCDALAKFKAEPGGFAAVVTDVMMPRMGGDLLAVQIRQAAPKLPILVMSGIPPAGTDAEQRARLQQLGLQDLLVKPYGEEQLLEALARALHECQ